MWILEELISTGLEAGAVIASGPPIDPTVAVSGACLLYGSISRLLEAVFLASFGYVVMRTEIFPRWTGRSAYVLAVVNLAFVPSMFFGNEPSHFYAANGWGTTASIGGIFMLWLLAVSVAILRSRVPTPDPLRTRRGSSRRTGSADANSHESSPPPPVGQTPPSAIAGKRAAGEWDGLKLRR